MIHELETAYFRGDTAWILVNAEWTKAARALTKGAEIACQIDDGYLNGYSQTLRRVHMSASDMALTPMPSDTWELGNERNVSNSYKSAITDLANVARNLSRLDKTIVKLISALDQSSVDHGAGLDTAATAVRPIRKNRP